MLLEILTWLNDNSGICIFWVIYIIGFLAGKYWKSWGDNAVMWLRKAEKIEFDIDDEKGHYTMKISWSITRISRDGSKFLKFMKKIRRAKNGTN